MSCDIMSCDMSCDLVTWDITSCHVTSWHVTSPHLIGTCSNIIFSFNLLTRPPLPQTIRPPKLAPNATRLIVTTETSLVQGRVLGSGAFGTVYKVRTSHWVEPDHTLGPSSLRATGHLRETPIATRWPSRYSMKRQPHHSPKLNCCRWVVNRRSSILLLRICRKVLSWQRWTTSMLFACTVSAWGNR